MRDRIVLTPSEKQTAMLGAWLSFRSFTSVDLSATLFEKARCDNAEFVDVDLHRADFRGANLTNSLFLRCNLSGCRFPNADLTGTRFVSCSGLDPAAIPGLCIRGAQVLQEGGPSPARIDGASESRSR
jgi:uncharacterized protein YjbI with pentapeptide repeats